MKKPTPPVRRPARRTRAQGPVPGKPKASGKDIPADGPAGNEADSDGNGSASGGIAEDGTVSRSKKTEGEKSGNPSLVGPVNINMGVLRRCQKHAKDLGVKSMKAYSEAALLYFVKNGLDPTEQVGSQDMATEVTKLRNQIFSFLQKQERAYILPMFGEITGQAGGVEKSLSTIIGQLEKVYELMFRIQQMVHVSTSTSLHVSGLEAGQIEQIKAENRAYVESRVREALGDQGK